MVPINILPTKFHFIDLRGRLLSLGPGIALTYTIQPDSILNYS